MKLTDISLISLKDRVLDIGEYNGYVSFCPFCYPEHVDLGLGNVIGFGTDSHGYVVEVSECPKCFQKSHHHTSLDMYETHLIFKKHKN